MLILYLMILLSLIISSALALLAILIGEKSQKDREKLSPYECGFDPLKHARLPFSLRFFLITIIFLVFDVEIALLLPMGLSLKMSDPYFIIISGLILTLILILGIIHEWNQGALSWIS
uniref:NADH-ubiquinone oxidoreductase chain 3 n=1 Tax=Parhyale hawaiensis TaxID=317513 RepID=Q6DVI7_9CRUS|nr:NADH dehydrogenase subunit 3 [Parhyale hawaiensis]AAT69312.1 NADH dehydrogenase subunit 3 [Parhyale hawaiensis]AYB71607.1 NADH dehydrogenase subunit 3 [Parhyale hawaiensis]